MEVTRLSLDKAISDCIVNITDFNPRTNTKMISALCSQTSLFVRLCTSSGREIIDQIAYILTGSVAELTIKTPLSCYGDSDFMMRLKFYMVTPFSTVVPTKECLKTFGSEEIELCCYRQTEFPAYVQLYFLGVLFFDQEADSFNFFSQAKGDFEPCFNGDSSKAHGPAIRHKYSSLHITGGYHEAYTFESADIVPCIFCPHWPPEARDFSERSRPHGWPTRSTIEEIVSMGCDFVQMSPPLYKKLDGRLQWRFSFSRAEIILIRTWSNSQKIVYHLLRYLNKNTKVFVYHRICTYHLKTLMLWNCERRPPEYWNCQQLMQIVADLLSELKQCVEGNRLQNYFIPDCNLVFKKRDDYERDSVNDAELSFTPLSSVDISDLIGWFLRNYLFVLAAKCPENESGKMVRDLRWSKSNDLMHGAGWVETFTRFLASDYRNTEKQFKDLNSSISLIYRWFDKLHKSCRYALRMLHEADGRLVNFFRAYILLKAAEKIQESNQLPNHCFVDNVLDVVNDFRDTNECSWEYATYDDSKETAESYFIKALFILRMFAVEKESDACLLLLELAKRCCRKSLEYNDSSAFSSAAVVYLALISHEQRLFEEAFALCMLVIECPCVGGEMRGISLDLIKMFHFPYLSAFVGFINLIHHLRTDRNPPEKRDAIEYPPIIVASVLLKDILDSCGSSVSITTPLQEKLTSRLIIDSNITDANETTEQNERKSTMEHISRLTSNRVIASVKTFSSMQKKSKQKIAIYTRRNVQNQPEISDDSFNSLVCLSTRHLAAFQRSVVEDLEPSKYCVITDQYLAMNSLRCGDYVTALERSERLLACCVQNITKPTMGHGIFHMIVSPPFHLLLDDQLKMFIDKTKHNCISNGDLCFIDTKVVALYIKSECLLKLDKPVFYFFQPVVDLQEYEILHRDCAPDGPFLLSGMIARYQLENVLRLLGGRLKLSPGGQIQGQLSDKDVSAYLDNPNILDMATKI